MFEGPEEVQLAADQGLNLLDLQRAAPFRCEASVVVALVESLAHRVVEHRPRHCPFSNPGHRILVGRHNRRRKDRPERPRGRNLTQMGSHLPSEKGGGAVTPAIRYQRMGLVT